MIRTVGLLTGPRDARGRLDPTSRAIGDALRRGYEVVFLTGGVDLIAQLEDRPVDLIFNNFSGARSRREQAAACALLDLADLPYTGSDSPAQLLALYKDLAKKIFTYHNIRTPGFLALDAGSDPEAARELERPLIVKPAAEGSSTGIGPDSVTGDFRQVARLVRRLLREHGGPALVEEYIEGREFSVGVMGNDPPAALPPVEINFTRAAGFYTHHIKARDAADTRRPIDLEPTLGKEISDLAVGAFRAIGCRDYARVDVRVNEDGVPYVLEINALPGLRPAYSDFPKAAAAAGLTYDEMIHHLVRLCRGRHETSVRVTS